MGRGIKAAVPLVFEPYKSYGKPEKLKEEYFSKGFLSNFNIEESESGLCYCIKKDLLLKNYKQFLLEFYATIEEDFEHRTEMNRENIPTANELEEFEDIFEDERRNRRVPFIDEGSPSYSGFNVLGCVCTKFWLFYSGGYKAELETYSILVHFEKILAKAVNNPLSNAVKFGIYV
ncbi:MAG: hypothetical protein FWH48_06810 [Oscillospiraceae bacterium]|nr:hypothetical protein [Oscillospiraceae bacterium]